MPWAHGCAGTASAVKAFESVIQELHLFHINNGGSGFEAVYRS